MTLLSMLIEKKNVCRLLFLKQNEYAKVCDLLKYKEPLQMKLKHNDNNAVQNNSMSTSSSMTSPKYSTCHYVPVTLTSFSFNIPLLWPRDLYVQIPLPGELSPWLWAELAPRHCSCLKHVFVKQLI